MAGEKGCEFRTQQSADSLGDLARTLMIPWERHGT
jgi:hypothetical protein